MGVKPGTQACQEGKEVDIGALGNDIGGGRRRGCDLGTAVPVVSQELGVREKSPACRLCDSVTLPQLPDVRFPCCALGVLFFSTLIKNLHLTTLTRRGTNSL